MFSLIAVLCLICFISASVIPNDDEERIVGGTNATIAAHPYQVSLQAYGSHFCGGSLYSRTVIVTAAHCVKAVQSIALSDLTVRLGSWNWKTGGVTRKFANMKIHPNFNPNTMEYDVALIRMAVAVNYSNKIKNITLQQNEPVKDAPGVVSGWGTLKSGATTLPTILQAVNVNFILRNSCASATYGYSTSIKPTMICAGSNGKDACQGDSGGPLISKNTGKLVGIVSWGSGCAKKGFPGVYADVPVLRTWIIQNAKTL